jgi:hypothetical protein
LITKRINMTFNSVIRELSVVPFGRRILQAAPASEALHPESE